MRSLKGEREKASAVGDMQDKHTNRQTDRKARKEERRNRQTDQKGKERDTDVVYMQGERGEADRQAEKGQAGRQTSRQGASE